MATCQTVRSTYATARSGAPAGMVGLRRVLVGWLAVLALLIQVSVPDLAMAARARAGLPAGFLTAATETDHCGSTPSDAQVGGEHDGRADDGSGHPVMEHDGLCAFCLALGIHGLVPATAAVRPRAVFPREVAAPAGAVVRPADHFLTCLNPRAPPA
ncbi:DUF2946 family protein [Azospirillum sp. CT11-132]|uniref:DUF2946 family protein n=1 Tax=Azospirillum sp. CT11-132 TaxID=3396317 RepID=UPI0039A56C08